MAKNKPCKKRLLAKAADCEKTGQQSRRKRLQRPGFIARISSAD
jgi:hypothetical protein